MRRKDIRLTQHAIDRYRERWRPNVSPDQARYELECMVAEKSLRKTDRPTDRGAVIYLLDRRIPVVVRDAREYGQTGWAIATVLPARPEPGFR